MVPSEPPFDPSQLESEVREFWQGRRLPPAGGRLGSRDGPQTLQFEGTFTSGDPLPLVAHRAVAADVDARYLMLAGRRAFGTLRFERTGVGPTEPEAGIALDRLGVWTGGNGSHPWDDESRRSRIESLMGRLAHQGVVVSRDLPLRACPTCAAPRSPERIIYQEEEGDAYLVRFDLSLDDRAVHALVWVDLPWRLLGACALLVQPDLPYVVARYQRGGAEELVLTSRSSLARFREWMPRAEFEVVEEHPGHYFEGRPYGYPLRHEFPSGASLSPPAGTILAVPDVTDSGSGIVPLVPGHGSTDADIAASRGVVGWPLITPRGQLDLTLMHKYAGLDLTSASEFILRDLEEGDAIFARLRVRRGVPHCAVCGTALLWMPGRAWCLEPSHLPADRLAEYARLLPGAPAPDRLEVAPWPVSGTSVRDEDGGIALLECGACERLEALDGPVACPCGERRHPVRRKLVPSLAGTLAAWARPDPFPITDAVRLYVGDRRRVPTVVHHLMASAALEGRPASLGLDVLPTVSDVALSDLAQANGADAVRLAYVRATSSEKASGSFPDHCRAERDRLASLWSLTGAVLAACDPALRTLCLQPIAGSLGELEPEDRALLARWERDRALAIADYDRFEPASVHRRLFRFLEGDLATYQGWIRERTQLPGSPPTKRAALRTMVHVLRGVVTLLAPMAPYSAEALWQKLSAGGASLFEGTVPPVDRALLNEELVAAWERWSSVVRAVGDFRTDCRVAGGTIVPNVTLVGAEEGLGDQLRADRPVVERLARVRRVEVGTPREPWAGRQRRVRPVDSEIQRLYPSQAAQIAHLLVRTPARKLAKGPSPDAELSVVIQGQPLRILPSMVEYVETLPPGVVPHPWPLGEMYLELPSEGQTPERVPPPLSTDAFWVVRRLQRQARRVPRRAGGPPPVAIIAATDPLSAELRGQADAIARYVGLSAVRVVDVTDEKPPWRFTGRTRTGSRWWIAVPGVPPPRATHKQRAERPRCRRVPMMPPSAPVDEVDYASEEALNRAQALRELGTTFDGLLEAPILGPSKIARAWDLGFTSVEAYRIAPFDQIVALPGFGEAVAEHLVSKLGGTVPVARPKHALRSPRTEGPAVRPVPFPPSAPVRSETPSSTGPTVSVAAPRPEPSRTEPEPTTAGTNEDVLPRPPQVPELPTGGAPPVIRRATEEPPAIGGTVEAMPPPPTNVELGTGAISLPGEEGAPGTEVPDGIPVAPSPVPEPVLPEAPQPEGENVVEAPAPEPPEITATQPPETEFTEPGGSREFEPTATGPSESVEHLPVPSSEPPAASLEPSADHEVPPVPEPAPPTEPSVPLEAEPSVSGPPIVPEILPTELAPNEPTPVPAPEPDVGGPRPEPAEPTVEPAPGSQEESGTPPTAGVIPPDATAAPAPEPSPLEPADVPETAVEPAVPDLVPETEIPSPSTPEPSPLEPATVPETVVEPVVPEVVLGTEVPLPSAPELPPEAATEEAASPSREVAPPFEPPVPPVPPPIPRVPSGIELELGASLFTSLQPFLDATAAGHRGICLVRDSPERIQAQLGPRPVDIYWLTNLGRGRTVKPSDLAGIFDLLRRSIREEHITAVFIEGVEYLVRLHGLDDVVGKLNELNDEAKTVDARVWVHLTPALLRGPDVERLVAEFGPRSPPGS